MSFHFSALETKIPFADADRQYPSPPRLAIDYIRLFTPCYYLFDWLGIDTSWICSQSSPLKTVYLTMRFGPIGLCMYWATTDNFLWKTGEIFYSFISRKDDLRQLQAEHYAERYLDGNMMAHRMIAHPQRHCIHYIFELWYIKELPFCAEYSKISIMKNHANCTWKTNQISLAIKIS